MGLFRCSSEFSGLRWMVPRMVLGDIVASLGFTWLLRLPMLGSMWMGSSAPCTVLRSVAVKRGDRASYQMMHCPIVPQWALMPFRGV
jgi:hypothetical protein